MLFGIGSGLSACGLFQAVNCNNKMFSFFFGQKKKREKTEKKSGRHGREMEEGKGEENREGRESRKDLTRKANFKKIF